MMKTTEQFEISLNRVNQNQHIFIGGDFNFLGWDWHNELLKMYHFMKYSKNILDDWPCTNYT